jgi:hypothetical protein
MLEDEYEKFTKELYDRNTLHLAGSDALEDSGDSECMKKRVDC